MTPLLSPPDLSTSRAPAPEKAPGSRALVVAALVCVLVSADSGALASRPGWSAAAAGSQTLPPAENHWPQWRGPGGNGVAPTSEAPLSFGADEGVKWKAEIPGRGSSSPIVWGDLIFVTTAVPLSGEEPPGDRARRRRPRLVEHEFRMLALRRDDGSEAWSRTAVVATPHEGYHRRYSSYANASPVTDGERVYAFFGSRGLYAYDFDGELVWARDFDVTMETFGQFGEASSPALDGDYLVLLFDHQGQSFIEAVEAHTGATLWKQLRDQDTSWSSPIIVENMGRRMVVTIGSDEVTAYDLTNGAVLWRIEEIMPHPIPTPVAGGGLLYVAGGAPERRLHAIDLATASGGTASVRWQHGGVAPYSPTPLLWDDELYVVRDGGLTGGDSRLSLLDAATGDPHYLEAGLPAGYTIKASPVGAAGRVYLATEEGDVLVLRRGAELEVLAVNSMGEPFIASPAIAHGDMILRGRTHLFCISTRGS